MKKAISIILCLLTVLCQAVLLSSAAPALPQSSHPYSISSDTTLTYTHDEPADFLSVTFSPDTYVENRYDFIYVYGADGAQIGKYTGSELSSKTLLIEGASYSVRLVSDSSITGYGFRVSDTQALSRDDVCKITLYDSDNCYELYARQNSTEDIILPFNTLTTYSKAFAGWSEEPDGAVVLSSLDGIKDYIAGKTDVVLYAKWITPYLASDEIYNFSNSYFYFDVDKEDEDDARYYMNDADHSRMVKNLYKTYGLSPVSVIGSIVFSFYPEWDFRGSCYGMSATTALQHYGLVDMLGYGKNAEKLIDLEPTKELISAINYYQYGAMVSFLCENVVIKDSPKIAAKNFRGIVDSVESGKIVMFTYYDGQLFVSSGHTVLLTGGYTDENGNHVLIMYDNRYPNDYQNAFTSRIIISPDYSEIHFISRGTREEDVCAFNWTDDFTAFDAININGNVSVLNWYKALFEHISRAFKLLMSK